MLFINLFGNKLVTIFVDWLSSGTTENSFEVVLLQKYLM